MLFIVIHLMLINSLDLVIPNSQALGLRKLIETLNYFQLQNESLGIRLQEEIGQKEDLSQRSVL